MAERRVSYRSDTFYNFYYLILCLIHDYKHPLLLSAQFILAGELGEEVHCVCVYRKLKPLPFLVPYPFPLASEL